MDTNIFIIAAYAVAGVLLSGLCLATWLAAKRVNTQMRERDTA